MMTPTQDVRTKWDNCKSAYVRGLNEDSSDSNYYLANEMKFLIPHVARKKPTKRKQNQDNNDQLSFADVLIAEKLFKKTDNFDQEPQSRAHQNVQQIPASQSISDQNKQQVPVPQSTSDLNKTNMQKGSSSSNVVQVIPPVRNRYMKRKSEAEILEKQGLEIVTETLKGIQKLAKCNKDNATEEGITKTLLPIKQALLQIPEDKLLQCIDEVMNVIDGFCT